MKPARRLRRGEAQKQGKPASFSRKPPAPCSPAPKADPWVNIVRSDGVLFRLRSMTDQIYSLEDETGWQHHWSTTYGMELAEARGGLETFSLSEMSITVDFIRSQYDGMDEAYAMTTDLKRPLLFVPLGDKVRLVDGWHRLFRAAAEGVDILLAYFLTQEEADACLVCKLPPGKGMDWGQPKQRG